MSRGLTPTQPNAAGTPHGPSFPSIAFRDLSFKYHTISAESLLKCTIQRLVACGLSKATLGRFVGKHITLTSCVALDAPALSTLLPA